MCAITIWIPGFGCTERWGHQTKLRFYSLVSHFPPLMHQALERELAPVEERLSRLNAMVRKVVTANPKETRQVQARQVEITTLWDKLKVPYRV